jgi:hypothetical protein
VQTVGTAGTDRRDAACRGSIGERPALDSFLLLFRHFQLQEMRRFKNRELQKKRRNLIMSSKILKYFEVYLLMTRFEFAARYLLWATNQRLKYIPSTAFGKTGMSKARFDDLHQFDVRVIAG